MLAIKTQTWLRVQLWLTLKVDYIAIWVDFRDSGKFFKAFFLFQITEYALSSNHLRIYISARGRYDIPQGRK